MKKNKIILGLLIIMTFILTGCTTYKSFSYTVVTGDYVTIKLTTNDGYDITRDLPFLIKKDGEVQCKGDFVTIEKYNQYMNAINTDNKVSMLENKSHKKLNYVFYNYDNEEYDYVMKIKDSNTGIIMYSDISEEAAKECFDRLEVTVE